MKSFTLFALVAAVPSVLAALTINTPSSVDECEPTQFNWSGGTAPYYLSIVPAGQVTAPATENFGSQSGTSYTWTVNLAQGTSITVVLKDSSGATAYSDIITIQPGTSSSCLTSGSSGSSGSSASSGGASTATGTGSTAAGSSSTASSSGSSPSSTSTKASGAGRLGVSSAFGVTAIMGLVGAALF